MTREELSAELRALQPQPADVIYIERRGTAFAWACTGGDTHAHALSSGTAGRPDAWIYYSGPWPFEDALHWDAFFDELLHEMDAMAGGGDRSRWPLGDPWPQRR